MRDIKKKELIKKEAVILRLRESVREKDNIERDMSNRAKY